MDSGALQWFFFLLFPGAWTTSRSGCAGYLGAPRFHLDLRKDQCQNKALWVAVEAAPKRGQLIMVIDTATYHIPYLCTSHADLPLSLVSKGAVVIWEIFFSLGKKQTHATGFPLVCRPHEHRGCVFCLLFLYMVLSLQMAFNAYYKVPMAK